MDGRNNPDGHARAASAHRLLAWIYGLVLVGLCIYIYSAKRVEMIGLLLAPAAMLALLCVFQVVLARGAWLRKPWARILSLVVGFILLLAFPIGTLIGAYLIRASWTPWLEGRGPASAPRGGWPSDAVRDRPSINNRR